MLQILSEVALDVLNKLTVKLLRQSGPLIEKWKKISYKHTNNKSSELPQIQAIKILKSSKNRSLLKLLHNTNRKIMSF